MLSVALTGLEKAINTYLSLDPITLGRIAQLKGKTIKINLTDLKCCFFIFPDDNGVKLMQDCSNKPDTTISGTSFGLFKVGCAQGDNTVLFKNSITIDGDTELGETIRYIMSNIDIDWEEHFSKIVGDTVAHKVGVGFHKILDMGRYTATTIRHNIREYLQEEAQCTPTQEEVENYIHAVAVLKNDVDRAEARLERILAKRKKST